MTEQEIREIGYKKLTVEHMTSYIKENHPDKVIAFGDVAYSYVKSETVYKNGAPVIVKEKISKTTGKIIPAHIKTKLVEITDEKELAQLRKEGKKPRFNTLAAKQWFVGEFFPDMLPTKKQPEANKSDSFFDDYMKAKQAEKENKTTRSKK